MVKTSQLKQLKSALSSAGLSRNSQPQKHKKKKSGEGTAIEKAKKAAKLEAIQRRLNPFDERVTRVKHDVGGRKLKGVVGKPAVSRQAGLEQRKKTLLVEYDQKDRAGGIVDRRFGEGDATMTPEERMLERFTRERQRQAKGAVFNLEDDEELTHYGQSLNALDDFDGAGIELDDDEEGGQIDANVVRHDHFGGFDDEKEDEPERTKSKAEVMSEIIAKSKAYKAERQEQREADDNTRHQLDQEFASIRDLLYAPAPPDPSSSGSNSIPLGKPRVQLPSNEAKPAEAEAEADTDTKGEKAGPVAKTDEDYDQFVRELVFDKRSRPTDRLKTEEELAKEAADALEKAEKARLRRMRGEESEDEDGRSGKRQRRAQADDLEDDFVEDEDPYGLGAGLEEMAGEDDDEGEEEESDESEESDEEGTEGSEEGSDDNESIEGDESDLSDLSDGAGEEDEPVEGEVEALVASKPRSSKSKRKSKNTPKSTLPFTFPFPSSHEELLGILEDVPEEDVPTVIQRIRVQYHPSLAEGNKQKLQSLVATLLDHTLHAASSPSPSFTLVSSLTPHIYALSSAYPTAAAQAFISKLTLMQKNLARGLAHGASSPDARTWPGTAELALLRLIGVVWSTSDLNHAVGTPAMLLIGQYLSQARLRNLGDVASGLFLCTLVLQYESYSKRFVPEAINFLLIACLNLAPHKFTAANTPGWFPVPDLGSLPGLKLKSSGKLTPGTPNLSTLLNLDGDGEAQDKLDLLALTLTLLTKFAQMYASLSGFVELFEPVKKVLEGLSLGKQSSELQKRHSSTLDAISRTLKHSLAARKPLKLQSHKPIPIATYAPQFDAQYSGRRPHDPDHERAASAKLRAEYRKERKGALRELRKDNKFLAAERAKRQEEVDTAYKQRMARVVGEMHSERAEQKQMEREKKREKKRAGRK
ncbi:putative nucleolar complex protein 14 OS=Schizosaccharomyces pombe (strain 972 / ATCC 24843) GN=nop14 PE=1 SV=1 [Rhizoctonia solani AG-1 IB]|uniref:Putative nucleolar complex protein 14 n=1 Tax=Thanatephorus cucumeris (strain AG1-IB / isolate 7/3/14) TaxID=1108050 RepID=A0A0B7FNM0_THACB|nr:putative nucleolar complex protein 14 OS=Schizosaccharomyces pombe (strain 972 / ATCC 24843) GN=nop14 PE=1 SV=1 [Rhizoctonia solani AG-1 IB]